MGTQTTTTEDRKTKLGNAHTKSWPSAKGQEVVKGDEVKTADGTVGVVDSRFTMQKKDKRVPYVCVRPKNGGKGHHVPSAEVTHTGKAPKTVPAAKNTAKVPPSDEVKSEAAKAAKRARPRAGAARGGTVIA